MKKISEENLIKKWEHAVQATKNFNRRVDALNKRRQKNNDLQYQEIVVKWKEECEKIRERNQIRHNKNKTFNEQKKAEVDKENEIIQKYNNEGELIAAHLVKIYCPLDVEIELDSKDTIVFYDEVFQNLADITLTETNLGIINQIFTPEVKKVRKVNENLTTFATEGEWGYISLDGEYLGYLDVEVLPKFEPRLFAPKPLIQFHQKRIESEKLPSKPEKSEIKLYQHKPLPTKPIETFVAVPFEETGMAQFKFGKW